MQGLRAILSDPVRLVQWFMVCRHTGVLLSSVVIARFLPLEDVGTFEMLMLSGYLITFFWSEAFLKGFLASQPKDKDKDAATAFLWLYVMGGAVAVAFLLSAADLLIPLFTGRASLHGLGLFCLYQMLIIAVWIAPFIGICTIRKLHFISIYVLAGPSLACLAGFGLRDDLKGLITGLIIYAFIGLVWILSGTSFVRKLPVKAVLMKTWPAAWPLVMYAISTGLARSFDSCLVPREFDGAQFAIFRYGAREFPLVVAVAAGLSTMMIPKLRGDHAIAELRTRSTRLMHLCYPVVAVTMISSPFLFQLFFGPAYEASAFIFNIYLLLTLTQLVFPQSILTARGDTRILWYVSLAELFVNVGASLVLLSYFGLQGIAMGTLVAFAFEKVLLVIIVSGRYGERASGIFNPYVLAGYTVLLVLAFNSAKWIAGV